MPDDIDWRDIYKVIEESRFSKFRDRIFFDPDFIAAHPDPALRERYIRQAFDERVERDFREIESRPGDVRDNILTEVYLKAAEPVNDKAPLPRPPDPLDRWRGRLPPLPDAPTPDRDR